MFQLIGERLGATLELAFFSVLIGVLLGVPLGVLAAVKRNTIIDYGSMIFALLGVSMPGFWIGLVLLSYVSINVDWLPLFGREGSLFPGIWTLLTRFDARELLTGLRYLLVPSLSLGTSMMAIITRLTRSNMLEVMGRDYSQRQARVIPVRWY